MLDKRLPKCVHPDCEHCPYKDCRWDTLTTADYTETNNRDYFLYRDSTGRALHKGSDPEYQYQRQLAYQREHRKPVDRHEYNQKYYAKHGEEIRQRQHDNYDTKENTKKCRKYRKKHLAKRKAYEKAYYQKNAEKKRKQALDNYYRKKTAVNV